MRTRPITRNTCAAASPWTLGNVDNTKNNDAGGATRRPKSELNQADAVVSGEYAAKLGEQLTPYKGDTINQRTLSATPGKTYRLGLWATLGKSNDDTPSTLKVQVKSNLASLGAVSSFSQYRKTVLSETVDAESKEGGKIHYSGSFIVPLDVDPYAALWVRHLADRSGLRLVRVHRQRHARRGLRGRVRRRVDCRDHSADQDRIRHRRRARPERHGRHRHDV